MSDSTQRSTDPGIEDAAGRNSWLRTAGSLVAFLLCGLSVYAGFADSLGINGPIHSALTDMRNGFSSAVRHWLGIEGGRLFYATPGVLAFVLSTIAIWILKGRRLWLPPLIRREIFLPKGASGDWLTKTLRGPPRTEYGVLIGWLDIFIWFLGYWAVVFQSLRIDINSMKYVAHFDVKHAVGYFMIHTVICCYLVVFYSALNGDRITREYIALIAICSMVFLFVDLILELK